MNTIQLESLSSDNGGQFVGEHKVKETISTHSHHCRLFLAPSPLTAFFLHIV